MEILSIWKYFYLDFDMLVTEHAFVETQTDPCKDLVRPYDHGKKG